MREGIISELQELIALKRYAQAVCYRPNQKARRNGNHVSKLRGRGMEFAEVRNYQAGDEIRHMEWRITAKTGRPHIKLYQEEKERPIVLMVDFNPSMFFGTRVAFKSVIAARLAALIAWTGATQGDRVGGFLFSANEHNEFLPRGRELGVLPFLATMSHYTKKVDSQNFAKGQDIGTALLKLHRVVKPGSIVVLISDFYHFGKDCEQHLNRLRAHNDVLVYHICDPLELRPPKPQQYAITDGRSEMILDTTQDKIQRSYQDYFEQKRLFLQNKLKSLQIQYIQVTAENDLAKLVRQTYPRRHHG